MANKVVCRDKYKEIIASIILIAFYIYSLFDFEIYCIEESVVWGRLIGATIVFSASLLIVWYKNNLSEKVNLLCVAIWTCVVPFICFFIVEFTQKEWGVLSGDGISYKMSLLNIGIYGIVLVVLFFLSGRLKFSLVTTFVLFTFAGVGMYFVTVFRGIALIAADFLSMKTALNVATGYDFTLRFPVYFAIWIGILSIIISLKVKFDFKFNYKLRIIMALIAVVLAGSFYAVYFHWDRMDKIKIRLWSPQDSYEKYGAALAFTRSIKFLMVEKPEGYSIEEVERIADKYKTVDDSDFENSEKPNVIIIMDEAFSDIQSIGANSFSTNKEVMPNIRALNENTQKGNLFVSNLGGGTAIMEFEMLTGHTNAFLPQKTIAYQILIKDESPSLASRFKSLGYQGIIAMHPYKANGYYRDKAYPLLGFNQFIDETMYECSDEDYVIGVNISDRTAFNRIIEEYEKYNDVSDKPFFSFLVTMQNHTPFSEVKDPEIVITDDEFKNETAERYLNYVHKSDEAFGELIEYYKQQEEPTLIAFFGDHPPNISTEFYNKLMGITGESTAMDSVRVKKTPLIIWANYDIDEKSLGDMSTNYISNIVMEGIGAPKTGYQQFLDKFMSEVDLINGIGYVGNDGKFYEAYDTSSPYYEIVREYMILQYNCLVDDDNRIEGFFE